MVNPHLAIERYLQRLKMDRRYLQKDVAAALEVSPQAMSRIFRTGKLTLEHLCMLSLFTGDSIDYIVGISKLRPNSIDNLSAAERQAMASFIAEMRAHYKTTD